MKCKPQERTIASICGLNPRIHPPVNLSSVDVELADSNLLVLSCQRVRTLSSGLRMGNNRGLRWVRFHLTHFREIPVELPSLPVTMLRVSSGYGMDPRQRQPVASSPIDDKIKDSPQSFLLPLPEAAVPSPQPPRPRPLSRFTPTFQTSAFEDSGTQSACGQPRTSGDHDSGCDVSVCLSHRARSRRPACGKHTLETVIV
jgi:hypothetical protein